MQTTFDLKEMRQTLLFPTLNLLFIKWKVWCLFVHGFSIHNSWWEKNPLGFTVVPCELWLETLAGYYVIVSKYNTKRLGKNYDLPILCQVKAIHLFFMMLNWGLSIGLFKSRFWAIHHLPGNSLVIILAQCSKKDWWIAHLTLDHRLNVNNLAQLKCWCTDFILKSSRLF